MLDVTAVVRRFRDAARPGEAGGGHDPRGETGREEIGRRGNEAIAARFDAVAALLERQHANRFRVQAYREGAATLRRLDRPVADLLRAEGLEGLRRLPGIGPVLARAIRDVLLTGRMPVLDRLRGEGDPVAVLRSIPGIGAGRAERLHHDLGIGTLEDLEAAAHDGRLAAVPGIGPKTLAGIRDVLAARLGRARAPIGIAARDLPHVREILDVDREYRDASARGALPTIAPRRFNPTRRRWLPVLHTHRGPRSYTALFSNTARAHQLHATEDWVVIYYDGAHTEGQATVITARRGPLAGRRIVRGREEECERYYGREIEERHGLRRGA